VGFWVDFAVKAGLVSLLLFAVASPDLPQFQGKAMAGRALTYPIAILIVPAAWLVVRRRHELPFPYAVDILIALPFLFDTAGNALNLYDRIWWWDDLNHLVNWAILTAGFGLLVARRPLSRAEVFGLAVGFGAVTAIVWELLEYVTFIRHSGELATAYTDTLGDLALGLTGSAIAALLIVTVAWQQGRKSPDASIP